MVLMLVGGLLLLVGVILYTVASPLGGIILSVTGIVAGLVGMSRYIGRNVGHAMAVAMGRGEGYAAARKCPFCAEFVKAEAILCRYCGSELPPLIINAELTKELEQLEYKLLVAAGAGDDKLVVELIEEGAAVNCQDEHGETALIKAAQHGHEAVVRILMDRKADLRIPNDQGYTAEDYARARSHRKVLKVLRGK